MSQGALCLSCETWLPTSTLALHTWCQETGFLSGMRVAPKLCGTLRCLGNEQVLGLTAGHRLVVR